MPKFSPFKSSSSRSLKGDDSTSEKQETQKQEKKKGRRRNFRFLRSVDQKKRGNKDNMKKTRDHAKQLAMAYNEAPTPTGTSSQNLLSNPDASTPSPTKKSQNNFFDPFGNVDPFQDHQSQRHMSLLDQHFAKGREKASRDPTASTISMSSRSGSVNDLARRRYQDDDSSHFSGFRMKRVDSSAGSIAGSVYSQASSYASRGSFNANVFDGANGGFTFDAFGLDESKVQDDVDAAMQALAGDGVGGFSFMQQDSDGESEFATQPWESPSTSRVSSPDDLEGFVDGFKPEKSRRVRNITGSTPPRWEKQRHPQANGDNSPWTQDPFAGENSASEVGTSSDFGGTKSEFIPESFQQPLPNAPFSGNKSDHGRSTSAYQDIGFDKLKSPRATIFKNKQSMQSGQRSDDEVDSHDGIQAEFAREFAQDFVKRNSPKYGLPGRPSNEFGSPRLSRRDDDDRSVSSRSSRKSAPIDLDTCEEWEDDGRSTFSAASRGSNASNTSRRSIPIDLDTCEEWEDDGKSVTSTNSNYRSRRRSGMIPADSLTPKSQFRSFKDRYESSKASESASTPAQSYRSRAAQHGSLRSSYSAAKATTGTPNHGRTAEEKKDDEDSTFPSRGNLKAKWKSKNKPATLPPESHPSSPVLSPGEDILVETDDGMSIEIMTPESAEVAGLSPRNRSSLINMEAMHRLREESESPPRVPSFANVTLRKAVNTDEAEDFVPDDDEYDDFPQQTSRPLSYRQQHASMEPSSPARKMTYRERRELELQREAEERLAEAEAAERTEGPKKMTYRERRELELQREAEEKARANGSRIQESPKQDVAALVRKRIAANKKVAGEGATSPSRVTTNSSAAPNSPIRFQQSPQGNLLDQAAVDALQSENAELQAKIAELEKAVSQKGSAASGAEQEDSADPKKVLGNMLGARLGLPPPPKPKAAEDDSDKPEDPKKMLGNMLGARLGLPPPPKAKAVEEDSDKPEDPKKMLGNMLGARLGLPPPPKAKAAEGDSDKPADPKKMLGNMLGARLGLPPGGPKPPAGATKPKANTSGRPALKDDPTYAKFFKMLKIGMPKEQVKHAMQRDGMDPSILDGDPNEPAGLPLKEDPKYAKYFKMLKIGISMHQVKHSMEMDGLVPDVMDQDHNLPASSALKRAKKKEPKVKDTHRRARLHWKSVKKVVKNSIWGKIDQDESMSVIDIDESEFNDLFQAELGKMETPKASSNQQKGVQVRVIDSKRANNGGIILARIKMSHDDMADAVDRMDSSVFTGEQVENIIEYLPTREERESLEKYMVSGGQDAAEKFNGLCECEKFMVSMMTVKHAKRKVNALLFKLQFDSCLESITHDADLIDEACEQLKNSSRLRQLLGIVLQFGNRLNTAGSSKQNKVGSFTLESLLKLKEAKAFDKKTTFLQYIVLIVQRNNKSLLNYTDDIPTVLKSDRVYWDQCLSDLEDVENQLENVRKIAIHESKNNTVYRFKKKKGNSDDDSISDDVDMTLEEEVAALRASQTGLFTLSAIKQVSALRDKVDKTQGKFRKLLEYFGEDGENKQPQDLFRIFVKFSRDFEKEKEVVFRKMKKKEREERKKAEKAGKPPMSGDRSSNISSRRPNFGNAAKDLKKDFTPTKKADSEVSDQPSKPVRSWPPVQTPSPVRGVYSDAAKDSRSDTQSNISEQASRSKPVRSWPPVQTPSPVRGVYSDAAKDSRSDTQSNISEQAGRNNKPVRSWPPVQTGTPIRNVYSDAATHGRSETQAMSPSPRPGAVGPVTPKDSAKQTFRDSARQRRLREMQEMRRSSYTPTKATELSNDSSFNSFASPESRRTPRTPSQTASSPYMSNPSPIKTFNEPNAGPQSPERGTTPTAGGNTTPSSLNSRNIMRNRRRLMEARRQRSTPTDTSSPWR